MGGLGSGDARGRSARALTRLPVASAPPATVRGVSKGTPFGSAPSRLVSGPSGEFAFRRAGVSGEAPLVLCQRFRGTIDDWDPALLDVLASERDVVVFDSLGVGSSSGTVPSTVAGMTGAALEFVSLLDVAEVDLLGWSMGGFVALDAALTRPEVVRRLVVAASKPGLIPGTPTPGPEVGRVAGKPVNDAEDLLFLFFPGTAEGRAAGLASLERLQSRSAEPTVVSAAGAQAQSAALTGWSTGVETAWDRLEELTLPMLVAAGAQDRLMDADNSYAMVRKLSNANLLVYGDAGHAFLFQHAQHFGRHVLDFLRQVGEP